MNRISEINVTYKRTNLNHENIKCSNDAFSLLNKVWNNDTIELVEEFKIILLNKANQILGVYHLSKGGVAGTIADAKLIFSVALKCMASAMILSHNHPSGNLKPSDADLKLTKSLVNAGELLQISVLDHIIMSSNGYYSFADNGDM